MKAFHPKLGFFLFLVTGTLLPVLGCGSSSGPPALIGKFSIVDAIFSAQDVGGFAFNGTSTIIAAGNFAAACDQETQALGVPNSETFAIAIASVDAAGTAVPATLPGRYAISGSAGPATSGLYAQAFFLRNDAACNADLELEVSTGDVTVTSLDASTVEGDLHFVAMVNTVTSSQHPEPQPTGDHLTAHFTAASCSALSFNVTRRCP